MLYVGIGMIAVALLLVVGALVTRASAKKILAAPFRKTGEIVANPSVADARGLVSCEGAVSAQQPLAAPCSNQPCVYYELTVEKKVQERTQQGTQTRWKNVSQQKQGSMFQVNDGTGPVTVLAHDGMDADLRESYKGPPPGGQGLGALTNMLASAIIGGEAVLEYRATEKIVPVQGNLFVMGKLQGGQLTKGDGKLVVSTRGRDGLVGSKKKTAVVLFALAGVLGIGGVPVMFLKAPGSATACAPTVRDTQTTACGLAAAYVEKDITQQDGSKKKMQVEEAKFSWEVTKAGGAYELTVNQAPNSKGSSNPRIQVEGPLGVPMNFGVNMGFLSGDSAQSFSTKTTKWLAPPVPGVIYTVYVWGDKGGPNDFRLSINEIAGSAGIGSAASAPGMTKH